MVIGRLKEAKVHSPGQVTVGNDTLGWHPFRMVRHEPKVADQREARGKSKPYSNTLTISFFTFALTERKAMRSIHPGCCSFVALPWAMNRLAFQAAQTKMCTRISYEQGEILITFYSMGIHWRFLQKQKKAHLRGTPLYIYILLCAYFTHTFLLLII